MRTNSTLQYAIEVINHPDSEPLSFEQAIIYLREDENLVNKDEIESFITVARTWVEEFLRRPILSTGFTYYLDSFGGDYTQIVLPRPSVSDVSEVRYVDEQGQSQVLSSELYRVDTKTLLPRITPAYSESWPCLYDEINAVQIDFTAGYENAAAVPKPIIQAIKMLTKHFYDNRDIVESGSVTEVPITVERLLGTYRVRG